MVGTADIPASASRPATTTESHRALVLRLLLTVSPDLPALSRQGLVSEAASIWRDDVSLRWLAGHESPASGATLRVLVTPRAVVSTVAGAHWTVGELLRFGHSSAIAVASITGAQRIVDESQHFGLLDLPATYEHRLGVVLGRAVAHEIGHYILHTNTHAPSGLMRATIDAREFADLRAGTFRLDEKARAHLAARAGRGMSAADGGELQFSYLAQ
jgi:hypothetical protein